MRLGGAGAQIDCAWCLVPDDIGQMDKWIDVGCLSISTDDL